MDKELIVLQHPLAVQLYFSKYNFDITNSYSRKFYEDILHLVPYKVYDTIGVDFERELENKTIKLALDKTPSGLNECRAIILETLKTLCEYDIVKHSDKMLNVVKITNHKFYIEIEDIGEHNGNGKIF